jgi:hypothetical protein
VRVNQSNAAEQGTAERALRLLTIDKRTAGNVEEADKGTH